MAGSPLSNPTDGDGRQNAAATADQLDESRLPAGVAFGEEKTQTWYATESPNTVHGQLHQALSTR